MSNLEGCFDRAAELVNRRRRGEFETLKALRQAAVARGLATMIAGMYEAHGINTLSQSIAPDIDLASQREAASAEVASDTQHLEQPEA